VKEPQLSIAQSLTMASGSQRHVIEKQTLEYRGFEIHVDPVSTSKDMFDIWFRIEGLISSPWPASPVAKIAAMPQPTECLSRLSKRKFPNSIVRRSERELRFATFLSRAQRDPGGRRSSRSAARHLSNSRFAYALRFFFQMALS
jgi:hypothetical protein